MLKYVQTPQGDLIFGSVQGSGGPARSGVVHWDGQNQKFRVIDPDGVGEDMYGSTAQIDAGYKLQNIGKWYDQNIANNKMEGMFEWYQRKMAEEALMNDLCKQYPNLDEARKEFETLFNIFKAR